jgi:hypothetical protein
VNFTWAISTGLSQWQRFMAAGVIPIPHLPFDFSGRFMNGQSDCRKFLELPVKIR